ncbi:outer membrane protein assembly factor BamB family protein [Halalkalicoccus salilacus]|uniref:outer membrane protein assembly factor BamB family protein n=1 Tax=Halalkalicoccus sp. GCM10025704 TaxID=3252662 RepID=UPI00361ED3A7
MHRRRGRKRGSDAGGDGNGSADAENGSNETREEEAEEGNVGTGAWPTFRYDAANTGVQPDAGGPSDLETEWTFETDGSVYASPSIVDGVVYVGSYDGTMYALDAADGTERWTFDVGENVLSSASIDGDYCYVGGSTGRSTRSKPRPARRRIGSRRTDPSARRRR